MLNKWSEVRDAFPTEVRGEYIDKFSHPDTVHAICEEFRASPTLDYQQDEADSSTAACWEALARYRHPLAAIRLLLKEVFFPCLDAS
jgi:hypothetical protein